jgi:tetratricopeptide (TPR) repeat protein
MKVFLTIITLALYLQTFSQNNQTLVSAFQKSYEFEYALNYSKAIEVLQAVYNETDYPTNIRLGWLHYLLGDFVKSQNFYKRAITNKPNSLEARFGYINPASYLENWDDVLQMYLDILKIDPNNSKALYWTAYGYNLRKDNKKALTHITKLLSLYPFDYDSNLLAGKISIGLGEINNAKKYLNDALLFNPYSEEVIQLLKGL